MSNSKSAMLKSVSQPSIFAVYSPSVPAVSFWGFFLSCLGLDFSGASSSMNYKATALNPEWPNFQEKKALPASCFGDFLGFINQTKWKIVSSHHIIAQC